MKCLCRREQFKADKKGRSSESLTSSYSSQTDEGEQLFDTGNTRGDESLHKQKLCVNYEEARALLGRLEYQRGNVEAALKVLNEIDIAAIAPKIKISLAQRRECHKSRCHKSRLHWDAPPMSLHAVSLFIEAIFLKARALQDLEKFKEAAQSDNVILDIVESALPEGLPAELSNVCNFWGMVHKSVQLLPELWKLAGFPHEAILSYRRALLSHWNLDSATYAKIQKEFAVYLLYGCCDASPPNLRYQMDGSFIPRNNIEEAVLLLMLLLRKFTLKRAEWDPSVIHHLTFALSVSGLLYSLASQVEELLPGAIGRKERYHTLALCYLGEDDDLVALNLLKMLLDDSEDPNCVEALLLASKICGEHSDYAKEGVSFARRALAHVHGGCDLMGSVANCLLGISLSAQARSSASDTERISRLCEALEVLEKAGDMVQGKDSRVLFNLCLEFAEQRKLGLARCYANQLLKMEAGSNVKTWILLARIVSAQRCYADAETIVDAALDQTGKWNQGELLRTKAKIQIAQGNMKNAIETYTQLFAVVQLRNKSIGAAMKYFKGAQNDRSLEVETWYDLANLYISMSQWRDADLCLSQLCSISPFSAARWHATGKMYEAKGLHKDALRAYAKALDIEPPHVPSLVSTAIILRKLGGQPLVSVRSFLTYALCIDRTNHIAWFNLGLHHESEGGKSKHEAAACYQVAAFLEDSAPVEPFR